MPPIKRNESLSLDAIESTTSVHIYNLSWWIQLKEHEEAKYQVSKGVG